MHVPRRKLWKLKGSNTKDDFREEFTGGVECEGGGGGSV